MHILSSNLGDVIMKKLFALIFAVAICLAGCASTGEDGSSSSLSSSPSSSTSSHVTSSSASSSSSSIQSSAPSSSAASSKSTVNSSKPAAPPSSSAAPAAPAEPEKKSVTVYVTESGKKYHSAGCQYLKKSSIPISLDDAKGKYSPCSKCNPPR